MSADFTPNLNPYKNPQTFRYWVQKTLPLVYDDALTVYELLAKVIDYINNLISDNQTMVGNIDAVNEAFEKLQEYVNDYFDTLDATAIIEEILNRFAEDGTLMRLLIPIVRESFTPTVVSSTAAMTDSAKIYILTTDQHVYFYNTTTNQFEDSGIIFGVPDEYFTDRGYLPTGSNVLDVNDTGVFIVRTDSNSYTYSGLPANYTAGAPGWLINYTWSAPTAALENKSTILMQSNHYWLSTGGGYWLFDSIQNTEVLNALKSTDIELENLRHKMEGGLDGLIIGAIGNTYSASLYNLPTFDLRDRENNRHFIIPVEEGEIMAIQPANPPVSPLDIGGTGGYTIYTGSNRTLYGWLKSKPETPNLNDESFADCLLESAHTNGRLLRHGSQALRYYTAPEGAKYFIISYSCANNTVPYLYYPVEIWQVIRKAKSQAEYEAGKYIDYLEARVGIENQVDEILEKFQNAEIADFSYNIEKTQIKNYLASTNYAGDTDYNLSYVLNFAPANAAAAAAGNNTRPEQLTITWDEYSGNNSGYLIKIGSQRWQTDNQTFNLTVDNFAPGKYRYSVSAVLTNTSTPGNLALVKEGYILVEGQVRFLNVSDIWNCRDLGGWNAQGNRKIKYGLLFRSTELDGTDGRGEIDDEGIQALENENVIAELDLDENDTPTLQHYTHCRIVAYEAGLTNESLKNNYGLAINTLAANIKKGYGTLFHCKAGTDRTGTLAFLIEGLLGVDEEQLSKDYELSSFGSYNVAGKVSQALRTSDNYKGMVKYIKNNFAGSTLADKIEALLLSLTATQESIDYLKSNAVE